VKKNTTIVFRCLSILLISGLGNLGERQIKNGLRGGKTGGAPERVGSKGPAVIGLFFVMMLFSDGFYVGIMEGASF